MLAVRTLDQPQPECCATCRYWGLAMYYDEAKSLPPDARFCPVLTANLDGCGGGDLRLLVCDAYAVEPFESDARELRWELEHGS